MKGKYIGLLVILLFGFAALLTPGVTMAVDCPPGTQTHYDNGALGTFCAEEVYVAGDNTCGTTACSGFQYEITSLLGESVSQVALTIPAAEFFCTTEIVRPTEKSVKIRLYEPSTGFSYLDETTDVITWDALKLDPSDKTNIDVFLTPMGAEPQLMELKTASGQQYITINGPKCCSETTLDTYRAPIRFAQSIKFGDDPLFTATYNECTGVLNKPEGFEELPYGASVREDGSSQWITVKKLGPRSGSILITQKPGTIDYYAFVGFGNRIFKKKLSGVPSQPSPCTPTGGSEIVRYENRVQVTYDLCGDMDMDSIKRCTKENGELVCNTATVSVTLYIAPNKQSGVDRNDQYEILFSTAEGSVISANPIYPCGPACRK